LVISATAMAKKKKSAPDPSRYTTMSVPKAKSEEPALVVHTGPSDPSTMASPGEAPAANDAPAEAQLSDAQALAATPVPPPPTLPKDWKLGPVGMDQRDAKELSRRLLQCETTFGVVASVHLERVSMRQGSNVELGRRVYSWIFDAHHVVLGDMNCEWRNMIGGANLGAHSQPMEAWVKPDTHTAAVRTGGTYLPGLTEPKKPRWKGDAVAITPPTFDLVVVARPLSVDLLPKQPGRKFTPAKLPRLLMKSLGWPSDHTSVVASVKSMSRTSRLTVATWNVADPFYFARFWPDAHFGFDFEEEDSRLNAIKRHVEQLLDLADVVGLQEVPADLVDRLVRCGLDRDFESQWVAAPSDKDTAWYDAAVGKRGCTSSAVGGIHAALPLPPVAHDMLLARRAVLVGPPGPALCRVSRLSMIEVDR
jgi:endonuclease/exonuclease/phosphatase family metal-dependent hydrolase